MAALPVFLGLGIVAQGIFGLVFPDRFVSLIRFFQTPPVLYGAAVIRVVVGAVLVHAAATSRVPVALRILGSLIVAGGLLTPLIGLRGANVILAWWSSGGDPLVRIWAGVALAIGAFVLYAVVPRHSAA